ncbi:MAG: PAS domain S-box protein, partial [Myxococcales bacterium]|nr:PAS domain S-box protein [Myxococcales bacterium]
MVHGGAIPLGAPAHADLVALGRSFWLDGDGAWTWGRPPEPPAEDAPEAADLPPGPWTSVVHPTHWTALEDALRRVRGTLCPTSALIRLSDGELVRCYLGLGQGGRVLGQLFPAEREEEEAEQYRLAVEAAPTGLLMVDTSGTITLVNRQIEAMFGYDRSELQGQPLDVLLPQSVRGHHTKLMAAFMAEPTSRPMGRNRDLFGVRRDGGEFAIEIGLSPAAVGTRQQVLASVVDVSQRKRQELELRERVEDLQRNRAQMDMLSEMSSLLQHAVTREEAHEIVAAFGRRLLAPIFPDVSVAIYTSRASADALELRQAWGPHAMQERFVPDDCWALRRSLPHWPVSADGSHDLPHCRHTCEAGWHLCLPISAHNQLVGQ